MSSGSGCIGLPRHDIHSLREGAQEDAHRPKRHFQYTASSLSCIKVHHISPEANPLALTRYGVKHPSETVVEGVAIVNHITKLVAGGDVEARE